MPFTLRTGAPLHLQDTEYYCGPASAQMILHTQVPLPDQAVLAGTFVGPGGEVYPDELAAMINGQATGGVAYAEVALATAKKSMRRAGWLMHQHGQPAVALVHDGGHWMVIEGFSAGRAPAGPSDPGFNLKKVFVRNPYPDLGLLRSNGSIGAAPPPAHQAGDVCGVATIEEEFYTWAGWLEQFTAWQGQFVVVCPSTRPIPVLGPPGGGVVPGPQTGGSWSGPSTPAQTDRVAMAPSDAARVARDELERSGVLDLDRWARAYEAGRTTAVRLVHRLPRGGGYFLVGLLSEQGHGVIVGLDAARAALLHAALNPAPVLRASLFGPLPEPPGTSQAAAPPGPRLVWTPSVGSRSPLFPFAEFQTGDRPAYVRLFDRRVFATLSNPPLRLR